VWEIKLLRGYDGSSKGRAFIKFGSPEAAKAGLAANGGEHMGRRLIVNYSADKPAPRTGGATPNSRPGQTVFVRNMAFMTTEESLRAHFGQCGEITAVRIAMDPNGLPKGFCHVEFNSVEAATAACGLN
jgi:RNA recognition motif-containing protein